MVKKRVPHPLLFLPSPFHLVMRSHRLAFTDFFRQGIGSELKSKAAERLGGREMRMRGKSWPEHQGRREGEVKLVCGVGGEGS